MMELSQHNREFLKKLVIRKEVDLSDDSAYDCQECYKFWDSEDVVQWFSNKGYTLYSRVPNPHYLRKETNPQLSYPLFQEYSYPYSCHNAQPEDGEGPSLSAADTTRRIVYAQDSHGRHVAIKAIRKESPEHQVLRFLDLQSMEVLRENCILPVLDFLPYDDSYFIVMPRWGTAVYEPVNYRTMRDVLFFMHSALKALAFLHSHNIVNRDVSLTNFVINHFGQSSGERLDAYWNTGRHQLLEQKIVYAMIDFDLAKILPLEVKREDCRLPAHESYVGSYGPADTSQGEFDYNPFVYDVGALGVIFCSEYQHYTKDVPLLAPFLDRMVTKNLRKRFTAAEALQFVERIILESGEYQLSELEYPNPERGMLSFETYDRWKSLPADFQLKWAAYHEPIGIPLSWKILRVIIANSWLPGSLVPNVRLLTFRIASVPRRIWGQCLHFISNLSNANIPTTILHLPSQLVAQLLSMSILTFSSSWIYRTQIISKHQKRR